jgi:penicillin-binding protein 2
MLVIDQLRKGDRRLQAVAVGILAGLLVLLAGLWYVQVVSARRYQASLKNQTFRTVRIPAVRGKIFDRNGLVLADNRPSYNLELYLDELRPQFEQVFTRWRAGRRVTRAQREQLATAVRYAVASNTVQTVAGLLQMPIPLGAREFERHHQQWPYRPLPVLENLTTAQVARFLELTPGVPGIDLEVQPIRYYPRGPAVAHVLGYLSRDDAAGEEDEGGFSYSMPSYNGAVGLEYALDAQLAGKPGVKSIVVNSLSYRDSVFNNLSYRDSETVWLSAEPGLNVTLTLDLPLQQATYAALQSAGGAVRGAAVVLDVSNGDVLALVSCPAYDPNEFVTGVSVARWAVLNDPKQRAMFNRATQGAYNPGSAFKLITALACLEGGLNPDEIYRVEPDRENPAKGCVFVGTRKIKDTAPPGDYDFIHAFKRSSNSYFVHYGLRAGRERILEMGRRFGLGEKIGLPTRQEVKGYFPPKEEVVGVWNAGNLADVCIGQEITATPLQMAVVTAAVANGGRVLVPRLVARIEPVEAGLGESLTNTVPVRVRRDAGVPARHLELIRTAMLAETEEEGGTGFAAFQQLNRTTGRMTPRIPGFRVGGKTGTAEIKEGGRLVDKITWFVAFGPFESPRYAVVVMVESGGSGGGTCAPVARQIFAAIAQRISGNRPPPVRLAARD